MKTNKCFECENTGYMYVSDGMDDVVKEYCYCNAGKNLEMRHAISNLAKSKTYA